MAAIWSIRRSVSDAKLTGLCAGIARHFGVDPLLVRVGAVLLALCGGLGVVLYLGGWLFVPQDGRSSAHLDELTNGATSRWSRDARLALVIIACVVVFAVTSPISPIGFWPVLILAAIWYFGYHRNRSRRISDAPPAAGSSALPPTPPAPPFRFPGPSTPFTDAAYAWQQRMAEHLHTPTPPRPGAESPTPFVAPAPDPTPWPRMPSAAAAPAGPQDPVAGQTAEHAAYLSVPDPVGLYADPAARVATAPSRRALSRTRSARRLRLVALVVLGVALSGMGVADTLGADLSLSAYLAVALLVVGLTLIAATWLGRAGGILPVGILVLIALVASAVLSPGGVSHDWTQTRTYASASQWPSAGDRFQGGSFDVDLRDLDPASLPGEARYAATVEWGELEIRPPEGVNLRIRYVVDQGVVLDDETTLGSGSTSGTVEPSDVTADEPTLTLDVTARFGAVRVTR